MFVDLAIQGRADVLVTGDQALLAMDIGVVIEQAADYKRRMG
jgi:predicted nucleic acid-binding protein